MALTLAEAAKLSNDIVLQGVIETIIQDSPILQALPFVEITGNGLTYNRENGAPSGSVLLRRRHVDGEHADVHADHGDA